MLETQKH